MEKMHPLVIEYYQTILGFNAPAFAKMNAKGAERKYTKVYRPLSYRLIQSHLRGDITLAVCLINTAGSARAAVLDIDEGGDAALMRVLEKATEHHFVAFAQSSATEEHNGGHVWLLFDGWRAPDQLRYLADTLATHTQVKVETYPTRKAIRLPLGVHRWTGKRGLLYLPHSLLNLDEGEHTVREAVKALRRLPFNSIASLPDLLMVSPRPSVDTSVRLSAAPEGSHDFIRHYNHATNLISLLERYGGRVAQWLPSGGALLHCPCPHHKHKDARASIEVRRAKNSQRYGELVVFGYAPDCLFYTERGQIVDAFSVFCKLNTLDPDEAVKQLSQQ